MFDDNAQRLVVLTLFLVVVELLVLAIGESFALGLKNDRSDTIPEQGGFLEDDNGQRIDPAVD